MTTAVKKHLIHTSSGHSNVDAFPEATGGARITLAGLNHTIITTSTLVLHLAVKTTTKKRLKTTNRNCTKLT